MMVCRFTFGLLSLLTLACGSVYTSSRSIPSVPVNLKPVFQESHISAKVFSYSPDNLSDSPHSVIFNYAKIINGAREYKKTFPDEEVIVNFAIYKVKKYVWVGTHRGDQKSYGWVADFDFAGENSEKFLWSIRRAYNQGVKIRMIYHNPDNDYGVSDYLDNDLTEGMDFKRVRWGTTASKQMHNKFVTANKMLDATGKVIENVVYVSTANFDSFGGKDRKSGQVHSNVPKLNLSQTGVLIDKNAGLMLSYNSYFDIIWKYAEEPSNTAFKSHMQNLHQKGSGSLNYHDDNVSAYFYPLSGGASDTDTAWVTTLNPLAHYTEKIINAPDERSEILIDAYWAETDKYTVSFCRRFNQVISDYRNKNPGNLLFRSIINKPLGMQSQIKEFDGQRLGTDRAPTHNKVYLFGLLDQKMYYTVIGSTNLATSGFTSKANNLLVIKESGYDNQPIYEKFKSLFYNSYEN